MINIQAHRLGLNFVFQNFPIAEKIHFPKLRPLRGVNTGRSLLCRPIL